MNLADNAFIIRATLPYKNFIEKALKCRWSMLIMLSKTHCEFVEISLCEVLRALACEVLGAQILLKHHWASKYWMSLSYH